MVDGCPSPVRKVLYTGESDPRNLSYRVNKGTRALSLLASSVVFLVLSMGEDIGRKEEIM